MEIYNQQQNVVYSGVMRDWRLSDESYDGLDSLAVRLFDRHGNIKWEDNDNYILGGHHNHQRHLADEPAFESAVLVNDQWNFARGVQQACFGRVRWTHYVRVVEGQDQVGASEVHIMVDDGEWLTFIARRQGTQEEINRHNRTIELLETIRTNWQSVYYSGGAFALSGEALATSSAYFAGAVIAKGGLGAAATAAGLTGIGCIALLALAAGAYLYRAYDQAMRASQELRFLWFDDFNA